MALRITLSPVTRVQLASEMRTSYTMCHLNHLSVTVIRAVITSATAAVLRASLGPPGLCSVIHVYMLLYLDTPGENCVNDKEQSKCSPRFAASSIVMTSPISLIIRALDRLFIEKRSLLSVVRLCCPMSMPWSRTKTFNLQSLARDNSEDGIRLSVQIRIISVVCRVGGGARFRKI